MSSPSHVLLVGASGRVGRMVHHSWPQGAEAPKLLTSQRRLDVATAGAFSWAPLDGPQRLLDQLSRGPRPVALVMLAGVTPGPGVDEAALAGNRALAEACLAAARAAGIGRVLLASSSAVYGVDKAGAAFNETALPLPQSSYGRAKLEMEAACDPARQAGLEVCVLRIGNVAGADALLAPLTGRPVDPAHPLRIDRFADGRGPLRSYIGPGTLARVLAALATHPAPLPTVLNVAAPSPVHMESLAQEAGWPHDLIAAPATAHQSITLGCGLLGRLCPLTDEDSLPETMVQQWKASWR